MPSTGLGEVSEAGQHADWSLCTPARQVGQQREVAPTWEAESVPMREWETRDTLEPQRGEGTEKDIEVPLSEELSGSERREFGSARPCAAAGSQGGGGGDGGPGAAAGVCSAASAAAGGHRAPRL